MSGAGTTAAVLLAVTFGWAAVAKLTRRRATAAAFGALGLPAAPALAVAVPLTEVAVALLLLVRPAAGGVTALALLVAFSAFLALRLRTGQPVACGCFGESRGGQASAATLARNAGLAVLAALALAAGEPVRPALPDIVAVTAAACAGAVAVALVDLKVRAGRVWDNRLGTGPGASP